MEEADYKKQSISNLKLLAKELAYNYFDASSIDLYPKCDNESNEKKESEYRINEGKISDLKKDVIKDFVEGIEGKSLEINEESRISDSSIKYSRNILVIGAGCSYNAFENIPLADKAIEEIHKRTVVDKSNNLTFFDLLGNGLLEKTEGKKLPNKEDKYQIVDGVIEKYNAEYRKQKLIRKDYTDSGKLDFETSLSLLTNFLPVSKIRALIKDTYDYRYSPTLFYEIVAHLFKHRFIDIIINFNFDELLDQAIEDEIGDGGFDKIISDGDCKPLDQLFLEGRLRQPLYIKPHGTVSHKSTLRFTKDHYHELPLDMREFLEEIFAAVDGDIKKKINLITVGFKMESIEFNEILKKNLPLNSQIFSFYYEKEVGVSKAEKEVDDKYEYNKGIIINLFKDKVSHTPKIYLIGHEFFLKNLNEINLSENNNLNIGLDVTKTSLGNTFHVLFEILSSYFTHKYKPRQIYKHLLIAEIFGNTKFWKNLQVPENMTKEEVLEIPLGKSYYSKDYFTSSKYFKDRVLVEILINLAVNQGKVNLSILMSGLVGNYYSLYYEKHKGDKLTLMKLIERIGLKDNEDSLGYKYLEIPQETKEAKPSEFLNKVITEVITRLVDNDKAECYFSDEFRKHLKDGNTREKVITLFEKIHRANNSKIHSQFRNPIYHMFQKYKITDLVSTDLLNDLHFTVGLQDKRINTICVIADYGYQVSKFLKDIIGKNIDVYLILQEKEGVEKNISILRKLVLESFKSNNQFLVYDKALLWFDERIHIFSLPINDHNYHMTLFLELDTNEPLIKQKDNVIQAIYYYKWGLSKRINPIRMVEKENFEYLLNRFVEHLEKVKQYYGDNKKRLEPLESLINGNLIN
ncbi:SIR2 family protein [Flavivirga aquimarina]|uniref:SIR2 family protein n=1 Tax=Flavivirga aquimarina TaxID=2027862 RepID=A0ABT8WGB0_9FLAO|nr:SIR2 family protein [Flavivirga aquimarina]MDO5972054.1 SIR2 family protein [Flavivirga aquimarina]